MVAEAPRERDQEDRRDPGRGRGRLHSARRRRRRSDSIAAPWSMERSDRPRHRRASRAHRKAHGRWGHCRVPQRGRCGALRDRGAGGHGRAQRGPVARAPHRISRRHSPRRRRRGERRRPDGRRREYRRTARSHLPARGAPPEKHSALAPLAAAVAALLIPISCGAMWFLAAEGSTPPGAARLSIVVLPFTNLSNDPAQDYFADGVTENLTTELSRLHNSFVISRNTAFTFKGKNLDARAIGKELGVRYALEGSVQRDQNRVLVNAQLIDAESDAQVWADRFE